MKYLGAPILDGNWQKYKDLCRTFRLTALKSALEKIVQVTDDVSLEQAREKVQKYVFNYFRGFFLRSKNLSSLKAVLNPPPFFFILLFSKVPSILAAKILTASPDKATLADRGATAERILFCCEFYC